MGMLESVVMDLLGVGQKTMRTIRGSMVEGEDWKKTAAGVEYTEAGVKTITMRTGIDLPGLRADAPEAEREVERAVERGATPEPATGLVATATAEFLKKGWRPGLVSAVLNGERVKVRVAAAGIAMVRPGMQIPVLRSQTAGVFNAIGRPRMAGRW